MNRREVLRILGSAAVVPVLAPFSPDTRLVIGRALHARLAGHALRTLDAQQNATVSRIADLIIPETDTPGAAAVKVNEFIDLLLTEWYAPEDRDRLFRGLADIDARSTQLRGARFAQLSAADQTAVLESLDGRDGDDGSAEDAFATLKELTLYGYFTSEVVMKDVIHYQVIPGRHDGCVPI